MGWNQSVPRAGLPGRRGCAAGGPGWRGHGRGLGDGQASSQAAGTWEANLNQPDMSNLPHLTVDGQSPNALK